MHRLLILCVLSLLILSCQPVASTKIIFVSPKGKPTARGDKVHPTSLRSALQRATPGTRIYLRGGFYAFANTVVIDRDADGENKPLKQLLAYQQEVPIFDFSGQPVHSKMRGIHLKGSHWKIEGITIQAAGDNGLYISGSHNSIVRLTTRFNRDTGIQLGRAKSVDGPTKWPSHNLIISSVSHDNADASGENADGFAAKLTVGPGNIFRYCVAHHNSDDGWDFYTKADTGPIGRLTVEYSIAYQNGALSDGRSFKAGDKNGFKLGGENIPVAHSVRGNLAFENGRHGFTYNQNLGAMKITDNIAINNRGRNFNFKEGAAIFSGNLSCNTAPALSDVVGAAGPSNQTWWDGTNAAACPATAALALHWDFSPDGRLRYRFE